MTTTRSEVAAPAKRGRRRLTVPAVLSATVGIFAVELATGPSGVGEHAGRAAVAQKLISLHTRYAAEGLCDLAVALVLLMLAAVARRERSAGRSLLVAGSAVGALLALIFGPLFLVLARDGAAGYASAYAAVPLRQAALLLSTSASAPLGLVLAGLALRLRAARRDHVPILATIAFLAAAADLLSVVPLPAADALGLGYFATIPLLGLIAWRLRGQ